MEEVHTITNLTTCKDCIKIVIILPKDCRMDTKSLVKSFEDLAKAPHVQPICRGCPNENVQV
ncbi:MAG: hypothetical protein E4H25_06215 [Methanomassiliicoccus sp.]|nr:MAG: hypothetical protein E4H25_06215 [Methanomassiliicoccus sp.]